MKFLVPIDLAKNELQNARVQNLSTPPASPEPGQIYFDTNNDVLNFYDGTGWVATGDISAASIDALSDVTITTVADRDFLVYDSDSNAWVNSTVDLGDLDDVSTSGATDGQALVYNSGSWAPATISYTLAGLTVVSLVDAATGDVLYFDGNNWVDKALDTDDVAEGSNEYYTDAKVDDRIAAASIDDLSDVATTGATTGDALVFDGEDWVPDAATYQKVSEKGQADGYASLDASGKIPTSELPDLAITDTFVVADEAARLALTAQRGDVAVQTDTGETYILAGDDPSATGDWVLLAEPGASVRSVSGTTPISSTGGINPTISLDNEGVTAAKLATDAVTTAKIEDGAVTADKLGADAVTNSKLADDAVQTENILDENVTEAKLSSTLAGKINAKTDSFSATIGDNSATTFTVTHNFGTRDVQVQVYEAANPFAQVVADVDHATTNTVTVKFAVAPAQDEYRVVVVG